MTTLCLISLSMKDWQPRLYEFKDSEYRIYSQERINKTKIIRKRILKLESL